MAVAINLKTHPDFTIEELIAATGWVAPSPRYRDNMARALAYFQATVPKHILRESDDAGPYNLRVNGTKIRLLNWMQGIDFGWNVDPHRLVGRGTPLIAFKDPSTRPGLVRGNWYTFPSTRQEGVAIHSSQTRVHKFKARTTFHCMQSTASDAYVGWFPHLPAQYRHGGAQQLFIWNASLVLEPA